MSYRGYEAVIGLEVHVQLKTKSKIFSADSTAFDAGDNENTSAITLGMPGTLPVLNEKAVEFGVKTGLALGCQISQRSVFSRKNYFYPDLPKGYQISQYDLPLCGSGQLVLQIDGKEKVVRIERAHLEEDAGKSTHFGDFTLLNYNRAGVPLLEIVSGPDMRSPQEAAEYARSIRQIVRYIEVCDGNLEEGSLRCDCNVSVRLVGQEKLGTKVEIKNINSFRFIEKAIEFEIDRQIDAIQSGEKIIQETRLWDPDKNRTFSMRTKEDAQDYRYFPEPDLLPVVISESYISKIKSTLPELPAQRYLRYVRDYLLPEYDAKVLTEEREVADFFEAVAKNCGNYKSASNWVMTELMRELNESKTSIVNSKIKAEDLGALIALIDQGKISGKIAKQIFQEMWIHSRKPAEIIKEKGLAQISDESAVNKVIDEVISANPTQVADYAAGKTKLFGFFVGAVMKLSNGQANPDVVNKLLKQRLDKN